MTELSQHKWDRGSASFLSLSQQAEPGRTGVRFPVPEELVKAGHHTNEPLPDSPETLDEALSQGDAREDIDPDDSITRPSDVDTMNNGGGLNEDT